MSVWVNVWRSATKAARGVSMIALVAGTHGCIDDFDDPKGYGAASGDDATGGRSGSSRGACFDLCEATVSCSGTDELTCKRQCVSTEALVDEAGCTDEYDDFIECASRLDDFCAGDGPCAGTLEPLIRCVSEYCGFGPCQ